MPTLNDLSLSQLTTAYGAIAGIAVKPKFFNNRRKAIARLEALLVQKGLTIDAVWECDPRRQNKDQWNSCLWHPEKVNTPAPAMATDPAPPEISDTTPAADADEADTAAEPAPEPISEPTWEDDEEDDIEPEQTGPYGEDNAQPAMATDPEPPATADTIATPVANTTPFDHFSDEDRAVSRWLNGPDETNAPTTPRVTDIIANVLGGTVDRSGPRPVIDLRRPAPATPEPEPDPAPPMVTAKPVETPDAATILSSQLAIKNIRLAQKHLGWLIRALINNANLNPEAAAMIALQAVSALELPEPTSQSNPATPRQPRTGSKQQTVIALLRRPEGATIAQIMTETDWQAHTIRGMIAGTLKKKLGLAITSTKAEGDERVYRATE